MKSNNIRNILEVLEQKRDEVTLKIKYKDKYLIIDTIGVDFNSNIIINLKKEK